MCISREVTVQTRTVQDILNNATRFTKRCLEFAGTSITIAKKSQLLISLWG